MQGFEADDLAKEDHELWQRIKGAQTRLGGQVVANVADIIGFQEKLAQRSLEEDPRRDAKIASLETALQNVVDEMDRVAAIIADPSLLSMSEGG